MAANMYRVGDYVYFETSSTAPYQIRRLEELNKTSSGNVEAKVMCFYRRRDISASLLAMADRLQDGSASIMGLNAVNEDRVNENDVNHLPSDTAPATNTSISNTDTAPATISNIDTAPATTNTDTSPATTNTDSAPATGTISNTDSAPATTNTDSAPATTISNTDSAPATTTIINTDSAPATTTTDTNAVAASGNGDITSTAVSATASASVSDSGGAIAATKVAAVGASQSPRALAAQLHRLHQRELFLSRQVETLSATQIRGKCTVTLLNETETPDSYIGTENAFFYSLVYDLQQKTLMADKGEIRVGARYQADVPQFATASTVAAAAATPTVTAAAAAATESGDRGESEGGVSPRETLLWRPASGLQDGLVDQYLLVARSVGTFARALDCSSSIKQPSLHMSAAAASRDITLLHAMDVLHRCDYDVGRAVTWLAPASGPVLCRDQMEQWSVSESNLFEEALNKFGKDFNDIRQDYLPWKSHAQLVDYYYMWKTTDRYVQQKRIKAAESDCKLKQVYIPNYSKSSAAAAAAAAAHLTNGGVRMVNGTASDSCHGKACSGCGESRSSQWFAWGAAHAGDRLCGACWDYWKRYGGVFQPTIADEPECLQLCSAASVSNTWCRPAPLPLQQQQLRCPSAGCQLLFGQRAQLIRHASSAHGLLLPGTGSSRPVTRTRPSFRMLPAPLARLARRLAGATPPPGGATIAATAAADLSAVRRAARQPLLAINCPAIRLHCQQIMSQLSEQQLRQLVSSSVAAAAAAGSGGGGGGTGTAGGGGGGLSAVSTRLMPGCQLQHPAWMKHVTATASHTLCQPARVAFPPPPRASDTHLVYIADGSIIYTPVDSSVQLSAGVTLVRKRGHDEVNGTAQDSASKRVRDMVSITPIHAQLNQSTTAAAAVLVAPSGGERVHHTNGGRFKMATVTRIGGGRQKFISLTDAPDDIMHVVNAPLKKMRSLLSVTELYRVARKPWRSLSPAASQALCDLRAGKIPL